MQSVHQVLAVSLLPAIILLYSVTEVRSLEIGGAADGGASKPVEEPTDPVAAILYEALDYSYTKQPEMLDIQESVLAFRWDQEIAQSAEALFLTADTNGDDKLEYKELVTLLTEFDSSQNENGQPSANSTFKNLFGDIKLENRKQEDIAKEALQKLKRYLLAQGLAPVCKESWFRAGAYCYKVVMDPICCKYEEAAKKCDEIDADIPTFVNDTEFNGLVRVLRRRGLFDWAFWINLRNSKHAMWLWQDEIATRNTSWLKGQPDGISTIGCIDNNTNVHCAVGITGPVPGWADESCDSKTKDILTVCQIRPEIPNVAVGDLNRFLFPVDNEDLSGDYTLPDGRKVSGGRSTDDLKALSGMLTDLNKWFLINHTDANADSTFPPVKTSIVQDNTPDAGCMANRVRNAQCVPQQGRRKKRGCVDRKKRTLFLEKNIGWPLPNTVIKYAFDLKAGDTPLIIAGHTRTHKTAQDVMKWWSEHTCVDFKEDNANPEVLITRKKGCWSSIGRDKNQGKAPGSVQLLSLGPGCDKFFTAAHEFGHLLGLEHEQVRRDRDRFVRVHYDNIEAGNFFNFDLCDECCEAPDYPYDYGSIMHYKSTEFAIKPNLQTLEDTKGGVYRKTMGSAWFPSFYDVYQINKALCKANCAGRKTNCVNGGYMHPRDCSSCICPSGFSGKRCETFEPSIGQSCGGILDAAAAAKTMMTPAYPERPGLLEKPIQARQSCTWIIKAPPGQVVVLSVENDTFSFPIDCRFGHVEIKFQKDLADSGIMYCGRTAPPVITSESRLMVVMIHIFQDAPKPEVTGFSATYQSIPPLPITSDTNVPDGTFDVQTPAFPTAAWTPLHTVVSPVNGGGAAMARKIAHDERDIDFEEDEADDEE